MRLPIADCGLRIVEQEKTEETEKNTTDFSSLFSLLSPVQNHIPSIVECRQR